MQIEISENEALEILIWACTATKKNKYRSALVDKVLGLYPDLLKGTGLSRTDLDSFEETSLRLSRSLREPVSQETLDIHRGLLIEWCRTDGPPVTCTARKVAEWIDQRWPSGKGVTDREVEIYETLLEEFAERGIVSSRAITEYRIDPNRVRNCPAGVEMYNRIRNGALQ